MFLFFGMQVLAIQTLNCTFLYHFTAKMHGCIMPCQDTCVEGMTLERTEFRSCVKVKVAVLGFHSLTVLMVSMDVNQH